MKRILTAICTTFLSTLTALAQNRFPKPDFESGYQYPEHHYAVPNETLWLSIDIILLVLLMGIVAWATVKKQTRKPIIWVSLISVLYFGFFRAGCVCSIGSIQNVTLALVDNSYVLPLSVLLFFILPIIFTFFFGRVFCAGVCPFGAFQELVNMRNFKLSRAVTTVLSMIPWIYLIFAVLYAITRTQFIICEFDPFIGIFRLSGDIVFITFGVLLLISGIFTGRPFCRFICPYGAILSIFSRVSIWKIEITKKGCINCELCHNSCPVDAIKPPYENKVKEERMQGVKRIVNYFVVLPIMVLAGAFLLRTLSDDLSQSNKDVRLYNMVMAHEANPQDRLSVELEAFYGQEGNTIAGLTQKYENVQSEFKIYSTFAGGLIGLVIAISLISLSIKRSRKEYEIINDDCVACGRCFGYCPQNDLLSNELSARNN